MISERHAFTMRRRVWQTVCVGVYAERESVCVCVLCVCVPKMTLSIANTFLLKAHVQDLMEIKPIERDYSGRLRGERDAEMGLCAC